MQSPVYAESYKYNADKKEHSKKLPVVWQLSAMHLTNNRTLFNGVILTKVPYGFKKKKGVFGNFIKVIWTYFMKVYADKKIFITTNGTTLHAITDKNGGFRIVADGLHEGEIEIFISDSKIPLQILQTYPVIFKDSNSDFNVISDIDDTIIYSYSADLFKRLGTLVFKTPQQRKVISFTQKMFEKFRNRNARIFYVSKSESNLFETITEFIDHNNLFKGMLLLTPYLNFRQLFSAKKGVNFKIDNIYFLIENTAPKNYVLVGDDSQLDMKIYHEIAKTFPNRILKIYIRQTKSEILSHQQTMMDQLKTAGVPVTYFKSDDKVEDPVFLKI